MSATSDTASFVIFHRDSTGKPDFIYPWDGATATYIVAFINVSRGALNHESTRRVLTSFAKDLDQWNRTPWYIGKTMEYLANDFIDKILRDFPLVAVEASLTNPDHQARGVRRTYDNDFLPQEHCILLNEQRIRDMCHAAKMAQEVGAEYDPHTVRFRGFMFMFTVVTMHELGHLFVTYLTKGQWNTPPPFYGNAVGISQGTRGEAGRKLEELLFGGVVGFYRHPKEGDRQPGVSYLATKKDVRRISEDSINDILLHRYHPPCQTGSVKVTADIPTLGHGLPPPGPISDPFTWRETQILLTSNASPPTLLVGSKSNLHRIPTQGFDPKLRIEAAGIGIGRAGESEYFWRH